LVSEQHGGDDAAPASGKEVEFSKWCIRA